MVKFISDWAPYGPSRQDPKIFEIDYRAATPHPTLTSAVEIAAELYRSLPGPVTVMVSGGVDSQASAYAAKVSGIDCRFVSFRYNGGLNDYDLHCPFYARHGIDVETRDIDILAFHENELLDWAHRYKTASPHILCHMKIASQVEGTVVFSGNIVSKHNGMLTINTIALERYAEISGQPVLGYFLNCDPHLFHALHAATEHIPGLTGYDEKLAYYDRAGFPVERQEKKFHGFEAIKILYDDHPVSVKARLLYKHRSSKRPYDLLFRHPLEAYEPFLDSGHIFSE